MNNCYKICTGITTFHRNLFLEGLLQEFEISAYIAKSIIFDNASSSETYNVVNQYDKTLYLASGINEGPAGAVYTILEKSLEFEWDYFWILDDDMIIDNEKVKVLLDWFYIIKDKEIGAVSPPLFTCSNGKVIITHPRKEKPMKVKMTNWSGLLIKREVVQIGVRPDPDLFFGWEDSDFALNISKHFSLYHVPYPAFEIPYNTQSGINYSSVHPLNLLGWRLNRNARMPWWKTYYYVRNTLIVGRKRHWIGYIFTLRYIFSSIACLDIKQIRCAFKGLVDGMLLIHGKIINPVKFYSEEVKSDINSK